MDGVCVGVVKPAVYFVADKKRPHGDGVDVVVVVAVGDAQSLDVAIFVYEINAKVARLALALQGFEYFCDGLRDVPQAARKCGRLTPDNFLDAAQTVVAAAKCARRARLLGGAVNVRGNYNFCTVGG